MSRFLGVALLLCIPAMAGSAFAVPVGVLDLSRSWWAASSVPGGSVPRGASIWIAVGLFLSAIGIGVAIGGLLFAALWCGLLLLVAVLERRAVAAGTGSRRWHIALVVALYAQGASALGLGLTLLGIVPNGYASGVMQEGSNPFYAALFVQYGLSACAVGVTSFITAGRLHGLRPLGSVDADSVDERLTSAST